jgi:Tol biopolymer transport system component
VTPVTAVSRDGNWLAFQSIDSPDRHVILRTVRLPDGGRSQVVVDTGDNAYHPFFSPSGNWLYFTPDHQAILRVPGPAQQWRPATPERVKTFDDASVFIEDPQPSGDGRGVLFARRRLTADLWMLKLER